MTVVEGVEKLTQLEHMLGQVRRFGGGNALVQKINSLVSSSTRAVTSAGGGMAADAFGNQRENATQSMAMNSESEGYFKDKGSNYQKDKLSGDA